ncbi:MAG: hypothetical protein ACXADO_06455 [Candidatus Thorarchaeota archaeon]|jgi:hypothetical protein
MGKPKTKAMGILALTLHDGEEAKVAVYRTGEDTELRFIHPRSGQSMSLLVDPSSQDKVEGWVRQVEAHCGQDMSVANWRWM